LLTVAFSCASDFALTLTLPPTVTVELLM